MSRITTVFLISTITATSAFGGALIELRPNPPIPEFGYDLNQNITVDVFLVDTGNPQGDIQFRGVFLDSSDTAPQLTVGPQFNWVNPFTIGAVFPNLPLTSWVYPLPLANSMFQIVLPNDGEVRLGDVNVNVGNTPGIYKLDFSNGDSQDPAFGARADFGFGTAGDPVTTWRSFTGEITGGSIQIPVAIPEPTSLLLLAGGAIALFKRRTAP